MKLTRTFRLPFPFYQAAVALFSPPAAAAPAAAAPTDPSCISASNPLRASFQYFPPHMRITGDDGRAWRIMPAMSYMQMHARVAGGDHV